jgi:acylphosphatase
MKHVSIRISGRVQGVFFRASTREQANILGIHGSVRNEEDGSVAIEAEGSDEAIERLIAWCRKGPKMAKVDHCDVKEGAVENLKGFVISR